MPDPVDSSDPFIGIDLTAGLDAVDEDGEELHQFLTIGIDDLLEYGLGHALRGSHESSAELASPPCWGMARRVAEIKSSVQTAP